MNRIFWVDEKRDTKITYADLLGDIGDKELLNGNIDHEDPYEIVLSLIASLLSGESVSIRPRNDKYNKENKNREKYIDVSNVRCSGVKDLIFRIGSPNEGWHLGIYTSGTTGEPKKVYNNFESLTRSVKQGSRFEGDTWALMYDPTHFAGVQVVLQAILNMNAIIYLFESTPKEISQSIKKYKISHISATPTFYRLKLSKIKEQHKSVERLTSGGEKFEKKVKKKLSSIFPRAEFRNIYALTEAGSLLQSNGEFFEIPKKYKDKIKVNDDGQLIIHNSLVNSKESSEIEGNWYHTGDFVEWNGDKFRFVGRESDFFNVGGYRVNPYQVEEFINSLNGVDDCTVSSKESSVTGNVPVAIVQPEETVDHADVMESVREAIGRLEPWKRPRKIEVVDELKQTRSGKKER